MNIKKIGIILIGLFFLSGCLDEIIKKICDRLPSDNAIITIFESEVISLYEDKKVVVVYSNVDNPDSGSLSLSECNDDFRFPNGSKIYINESNKKEIIITKILDSEATSFFSNSIGALNEEDQFIVEIQFYDSCDSTSPSLSFSSSPRLLEWDQIQIPKEIEAALEQCEINGVSETIRVFDAIL